MLRRESFANYDRRQPATYPLLKAELNRRGIVDDRIVQTVVFLCHALGTGTNTPTVYLGTNPASPLAPVGHNVAAKVAAKDTADSDD